jgi:hypothetical protein
MSADNYYVILPHPETAGFAAVMAFASNDTPVEIQPGSPSYPTLGAALLWAQEQYSEYNPWVAPSAFLRDRWLEVHGEEPAGGPNA